MQGGGGASTGSQPVLLPDSWILEDPSHEASSACTWPHQHAHGLNSMHMASSACTWPHQHAHGLNSMHMASTACTWPQQYAHGVHILPSTTAWHAFDPTFLGRLLRVARGAGEGRSPLARGGGEVLNGLPDGGYVAVAAGGYVAVAAGGYVAVAAASLHSRFGKPIYWPIGKTM